MREMLTYLGTALPRFTSPAARLLALQCALRIDTRGRVRLPAVLLRGMRLRGHRELWHELAHAGWLELPDFRSGLVQLRLLTALVLAAHASPHAEHSIDMDTLARLCGHCPQQTGELLDRLVATRTLRAWLHNRETDEVLWHLPNCRHEPAPPYGSSDARKLSPGLRFATEAFPSSI